MSEASSLSNVYEGGESDENNYGDEQMYAEDDIDPDDPYQINNLHEIEHDTLKEMYTQVVDELLDLQLEFEEKLAEAEEHSASELEKQKNELEA